MGLRDDQKQETRRKLYAAAMRLASTGGFASLSLRQVTREAGIAPTSFYRHFNDMEELGRALVDEMGLTLRNMINEALRRIETEGSAISTSIDLFLGFLDQNPDLFRLLIAERYGGSAALRSAIDKEIQLFIDDVQRNLQLRADALEQPIAYVEEAAEAMVTLVFDIGVQALALSPAERGRLRERLCRQLYLLALGAKALACQPPRT